MKRLIPYLTFACLTTFAANITFPVFAGGCSSHRNKTAEINCAKDDKECQAKKAENFDLKDITKS
tara:strand:+ start:418 stop:612 length:195 start_codon:yes stop_codon:yes gene_type:complete